MMKTLLALLLICLTLPLQAQPLDPDSTQLVVLDGSRLHFGTTIYPYRKENSINWLLKQARELGLDELRLAVPRDQVERTSDAGHYDPRHYRDPHPEVLKALRASRLDVILVLIGAGRDEKGKTIDWPRQTDGSIDGPRAAPGYANYVRWMVSQTRDFVRCYEMWNEAFNTISVRGTGTGKGFGAGGSQANADSYSAMMLPAVKRIRELAPHCAVAVEGNYWNLERSADLSSGYQELLRIADYAVIHPYGYKPSGYQKDGHLYQCWVNYQKRNPRLRFWWTEYGVSPHECNISHDWTDFGQAKSVLRATVLHLREGVEHLDIFDLYYPSKVNLSLLHVRTRQPRLAFRALRNLLLAIRGAGVAGPKLAPLRRDALPAGVRDLAIARSTGYLYLIWQESPADRMDSKVSDMNVSLHFPGWGIVAVQDPLTGRPVKCENAVVPVPDYPLLCELRPLK